MPPPAEPDAPTLVRRLASIPGLAVRPGAPLAPLTTFGIGGPAELLVEVRTLRALAALMRETRDDGTPRLVLGLGSNLLVPDEGLGGLVMRLRGDFARVRFAGARVWAGAGVALPQLAKRTAEAGLSGLEALSGFPSTVGGAVVMNAGCYGVEIRDVLVRTTVVEADGTVRRWAVEELDAGYRTTRLQGSGCVVARASFRLRPGDRRASLARIAELNERRWASLPGGGGHAGSVFRNPEGDHAGRLIEQAGLKGLRRGGAEISPAHANVIVNRGGATSDDVLALMIEARRAVGERFSVELEPEVVLAGDLRRRWERAVGGG